MRIFVTKAFKRFQRKERIKDAALLEAIDRARQGLIDADLGANLIKQRIARPGEGRSGGYRTIIAYRENQRSVFLFGFAKNEMANISKADHRDLADYGAMLLQLDDDGIETMIENDQLKEIES